MIKPQVTLGIYEKALRWTGDWSEFFAQVRQGGFSFSDLSIDESDLRSARLDWDWQQCQEVREAAHANGVQIGGLCLSLHRKVMPGAQDPQTRQAALDVYYRAIDLAVMLGVSVIQVAGYFAYYDSDQSGAKERYLEVLGQALPYAAQKGVILAIENVDGNDIAAIEDAMGVLGRFASPWLQVYPDVGNVAEHGGDAQGELASGQGHMVALHVKDTLPGHPRRIPLGEGNADFAASFTELARQGWFGRVMLEMWNDDAPDSTQICIAAREKLEGMLTQANIEVVKN